MCIIISTISDSVCMLFNYKLLADVELNFEKKVLKFLHSGCGCSRGAKGGPFSKQFEEETVLYNLHNCIKLLTNAKLDLVVLASIQAFTRKEDIGSKRSRSPRCNFQFQSVLQLFSDGRNIRALAQTVGALVKSVTALAQTVRALVKNVKPVFKTVEYPSTVR